MAGGLTGAYKVRQQCDAKQKKVLGTESQNIKTYNKLPKSNKKRGKCTAVYPGVRHPKTQETLRELRLTAAAIIQHRSSSVSKAYILLHLYDDGG